MLSEKFSPRTVDRRARRTALCCTACPDTRSKQRVTFRIDRELGDALRQLPNQTAFVERVLREALGRICPLCDGSGEVRDVHLAVSNLKRFAIGRLDRVGAAQLKALVRLGRQLLATNLELEPSRDDGELEFRLARADELLLAGRIPRGSSRPSTDPLTGAPADPANRRSPPCRR